MISKRVMFLSLVGFLFGVIMLIGCGRQEKTVSTSAQYPVKPITMIVPYSAGGSTDMMMRAMEKTATKYLGQTLVVTNIPGGAGTIGWNELAGAKADGYTVGYVGKSALVQPLYGQTRYDYPTALEPLVQVMSTPIIVAVRADQTWESIDELLEYARLHPGEIKFGHPGLGSGNHIAGELFAKETGVNIIQVPFRGEAENLAALLGGHIQLIFINPPSIKEYMKSGKVKALGVLAEHRMVDPVFKNVPTLKERGWNIVFDIWQGIGAPKGMPTEVKDRLTDGLKNIAQDPEFQKKMEDLGMSVEYLGPKEFGEKWLTENAKLEKIVKETGIAEQIASQMK